MNNRRKLVIALGGGILSSPLAAFSQQPGKVRRVGVLSITEESDPEGRARVSAFQEAMQALGWSDGRNIQYEYHWGAGEPKRSNMLALKLVAAAPDAILVNGTPGVTALQQATRNIPIVFVVVTDPVGAGFVQSRARPGGNITGFSTFEPEIGSKWLELLIEAAPGLRRVAGILSPEFKGFAGVWREVENSAAKAGVEVTSLVFRNKEDDIESAVARFAQQRRGGLIVLPTAVNSVARDRIFAMAARHQLPAMYPFRHYAVSGGLMAYGFQPTDLWRRSASYIDRILKGQRPAELAVQAPTKFELAINLKTAKALGLTIPRALLARADEVIE